MTLEVYMKSGNVLVLDRIKKYEVSSRGDTIVRLELSWKRPERQLIVTSIDLSNIEAICVRSNWWQRLPWRK
jgi:hypothetical protein